jgi:hypothetical protein
MRLIFAPFAPGTSDRVSMRAIVFIRFIRFLGGRVPDNRTEASIPPVLRFSFRRKRQPLLPSPYPNAAQPARSALSVAQLAAPFERARFCRLSSSGGLCRIPCKCPAQQHAGSIPDAAIIIVSYNFADSPGQHCQSIAFSGFR